MNTVIINKKEYQKVFRAMRIVEAKKKRGFSDVAFGILKNAFGKGTSVSYVAKARKAWRG